MNRKTQTKDVMDCSDWDGSYSAIVIQLRQSAANMARRRSEKNRDASGRYLAPANSTVRLEKQEPLSEVTLLPQRRLHNVKIYQCAPFSIIASDCSIVPMVVDTGALTDCT